MFLVYGLQKSGLSIIKLFEKKNKQFQIWDDDLKVRKNLKKFFDRKLFINPNNNLNNFKKIYVSPGISIRQKKISKNKKNKNKKRFKFIFIILK
ncbi:MAG: hypothetical protein CBD97_03685 [Pelagibacteraceae bacterium TMED237]|nr:MAG: hypothetical protein CBD97_03685 [Pelagibacteraceae bacterium TMED237]